MSKYDNLDSFDKIRQDFKDKSAKELDSYLDEAVNEIVDDFDPKDYPKFEDMNLPKDGFFERVFKGLKLRATIKGETKVGQIAGIGLDVLGFVFPRVDKIRNKSKKVLYLTESQTNNKNMEWIKNRLKERTTWQGIVAVLTALGVSLSPDQKEAIITAGASLVTVIWLFVKEPQSKDAK